MDSQENRALAALDHEIDTPVVFGWTTEKLCLYRKLLKKYIETAISADSADSARVQQSPSSSCAFFNN
jgi:hypothetical protein